RPRHDLDRLRAVGRPTPDGPETVEVLPGTQPMTRHVLGSRGMPNVRGRGRGDLIVRFVVMVPTELSPEGRELVDKLRPHLGTPRKAEEENGDGKDPKGKESIVDRILRGR